MPAAAARFFALAMPAATTLAAAAGSTAGEAAAGVGSGVEAMAGRWWWLRGR